MQTIISTSLYHPPLGTSKNHIPTPALIIDLQALESNISIMSEYFRNRESRLRPHFKTHKCPMIAKKQMEAGAIGLTCAKLSEAELLVETGIPSILIANQVVDPLKIARLATLALGCELILAVDQIQNLSDISKAAEAAGSIVHIVIEVDVGMQRAGVQPGEPALRLAEACWHLPGVHFAGVLGYEGFTVFETDRTVRQKNVRLAMQALVETALLIRQAGMPVEIVSAGGTGTYDITGDFPGVTEVEAGSYVFMDTKYSQLGLPFKQALSLLSMVTSIHDSTRCILDAGIKVITTDNGMPEIITQGLNLVKLNEEHGIVDVDPEQVTPQPGMVVEITPSHVCTTVNLHDHYYVMQGEQLVDIWEISGRGKSL